MDFISQRAGNKRPQFAITLETCVCVSVKWLNGTRSLLDQLEILNVELQDTRRRTRTQV